MSQSFNTITLEIDDQGIATVTINRPKKLNALNDEVLNELADLFKAIQVNDDVKAVIVTGAGEKAFVAGADIKELRELDNQSGRMASQKGQRIFQLIEDTRKPVIAAVNGFALGGGAELTMACHLRVAGENAVFGLPEVGLGLIPGYGGTQRLPELVGKARALEMILTGKQISAAEAEKMGLVNEVSENPKEASVKLLETILKKGPIAVGKAIEAVYGSGYDSGYRVEADIFGQLCETDDFIEGTSAFLEKRKPEFKGR